MADENYITAAGLQRIQLEIEFLRTVDRPKVVAEVSYAASLGDRSENAEYIYGKKRLRQIDSRLSWLLRCLDRVQAVDPVTLSGDRVRFGATVVVVDDQGEEKTWRVYGEHEVDIAAGVLSHKSPIAHALIGRRAGDVVTVRAPAGDRELEIVEVRFDAQEPVVIPEWKLNRDGSPTSVEAPEAG